MTVASAITQAIETTARLVGMGSTSPGFIDVREPHTGKLLFKIDPTRWIIEIQVRSVKTLVDLTQYLERGS